MFGYVVVLQSVSLTAFVFNYLVRLDPLLVLSLRLPLFEVLELEPLLLLLPLVEVPRLLFVDLLSSLVVVVPRVLPLVPLLFEPVVVALPRLLLEPLFVALPRLLLEPLFVALPRLLLPEPLLVPEVVLPRPLLEPLFTVLSRPPVEPVFTVFPRLFEPVVALPRPLTEPLLAEVLRFVVPGLPPLFTLLPVRAPPTLLNAVERLPEAPLLPPT